MKPIPVPPLLILVVALVASGTVDAQAPARAVISGTVESGVTRVTIGPETTYSWEPRAEAAVGQDGSFELSCAVPGPVVWSLLSFEGRRRVGSLPIYLVPGQSLKVRVAGRDSVFEGDGARESQRAYDARFAVLRQTMVDNRDGDPDQAAAFLQSFEAHELGGADGGEVSPEFRELMLEVARRETEFVRAAGGEEYQSFLRELFASRPTTIALASVRDWHARLDRLTAAFDEAGLFGDADGGVEARVEWVGVPFLQSEFSIYVFDRAINGKRWFRDPLRPRMLPLEKFVVGDQDRTRWEQTVARLDETEQDYADLMVGKPAPEFRFESVDGEFVSLADFRGKFVVLDVWNLACKPCIAQIPHIKRLEGELEAAGVRVRVRFRRRSGR